ncbi:membrane-bound lytic murein transglycosylase B [Marinobacter daqiaonensis]|uniref:Membrane-bound lytic murein transglycosylase B n=1 Tax=Marinobacter daqiaonensis TaxID=650891 RepID=A0A1I6J4T6_9GAMM|nr:lytic murein transglycosylase B [Marinobacter daqiaonensis]SFR73881.1 membrane-bound lytic murein transglycosylase B [Marinobacter daqiaonensis]
MNLLQLTVSLTLLGIFTTAAGAGYGEHPEARAFVREMTREYGFDENRLRAWLGEARRQEQVIERISSPAERTLEWHEYRDIFIKPERISGGIAFLEEYEDAFRRAQRQYGVPREIIAAIIGVETWYGRYRGSYRVLDALATLAFDYPPRSRFFRSELQQFFLMVREQGFEPGNMKGSYAGAMGYGQFIASSYRHYAIDFDGDGVVDIFDNPVDAIGSVANYFAEHRWKPGGPVAFRLDDGVVVPPSLLSGELKPRFTVSDYRQAGVSVPTHLAGNEPARMIMVQGADGPQWWLTCHNFYVITRYNHSHLYGLAVKVLADELSGPARVGSASTGVQEKTDE